MKLIIFGTGLFLDNRWSFLKNEDIECFVDNDIRKHGQKKYGYEIIAPANVGGRLFDYFCIMTRNESVVDIRKQLFSIGIPAEKIIDFNQYTLMRNPLEKRFVLWGAGRFCENRISTFAGKNVIACIDSDKSKIGKCVNNTLIVAPSETVKMVFDYVVLMVGTSLHQEILDAIEKMKIPTEKVITFTDFVNKFATRDVVMDETAYFFSHYNQPGKIQQRNCREAVDFKPLISIVTPYYNAAKYIEETFNSVINQTFPWFEWIIVDDGSTDDASVQMLDTLGKKDARIRVLHQKNQGQAVARNNGFSDSVTDIVVPLDSDDVIEPQYLEYVFWGLYFNKDASWAYTASYGFGEENYLWKKHFDVDVMRKSNQLTCTAAIRKSVWEKIGGYKKESFLYDEDWRFWLEALACGYYPVVLSGYKFGYRRLRRSAMSDLRADRERDAKNHEIIARTADTIKDNVSYDVKEYPTKKGDLFQMPPAIEWDYLKYHDETNSEKHVLWIIPWMVMGGADKFNYDAMEGLKEAGYRISVITTIPSRNDWQYRFARITDDIYNLPEFLDTNNYLSFVEYYIKSRNVKVVMVTNSTLGYYMIPYLRYRFPNMNIYDYVHMEEWYWRAGGHARTSAIMSPFVDKTYVCNSATRDVMINHFGIPSEKVDTMHIGVDEKEFDPATTEKGVLYKKLGIDCTRPIVLFPCRIDGQKRPLFMAEIAKKVVEQCPSVVFAVVGDGPLEKQLKQRIQQYGLQKNVRLLGRIDDMKTCYRDAKITLICSVKEGLALTAYESCSMGTPVISADVGGQKDLIDDNVGKLITYRGNEKNGLRIDDIDEAELMDYVIAIFELLNDDEKYHACVSNCRQRILDGFTIGKMKQQIVREFNNKSLSDQSNDYIMALREFYMLAVEREFH